MVLLAAVSGLAVAQDSKNLLEIDAASFRPVQTDALSGVAIDPIGLDRSKRPCARIKMHINRMTRDEIANLVIQPIGGNVILMKKVVASEGNGLILEMTAKAPTRFYIHHDEFGDSNEVSLNLEGNKEYWLEACLNQLYPITVNTNMKEASVYIDNVYKGKTNDEFYLLVHDVLPGDHTLRIVCGSSVSEKQISVYKESLVFRCDVNTVTARPQYVVFTVQPKNAVVAIDDKLYTPDEGGAVQVLLQNGAYTYSVESKDYHSENGSFVVDGKKVDKRVELLPAFGWLNVENTAVLNGANVYVDERNFGTIPLSRDVRLPSGEHKVRIVKHKYKPFEQTVTISDNQKFTLSPALEADFAVVTINAADGCEIWVNNERKGFAPWKGELASGTYIFEARKAGHRTTMITQNIAVDPHEQSYKIDDPKPIMGTLDITSTPANAEIYIDGKSVGRTPMMLDVVIGTRTIKLTKDGYGEYQSSVVVSESQTTAFTHKFDAINAVFTEAKALFDKKDYSNALPKFRTAALQGHAGSCAYLGRVYQYGYGVDKNLTTAVSWYRQGAEKGDAESQYRLGNCYYNGYGVTKDLQQAFNLFKKSAEQDNTSAQNMVGICYRNGYGVAKNDAEAVKWYRRAADAGYSTSQYNLGLCYEYGRGVATNKEEAKIWYQKAADQGHEKSKTKLKELGVSTTSNSTTSTSSTSASSSSRPTTTTTTTSRPTSVTTRPTTTTTTSRPTTSSHRGMIGKVNGHKSSGNGKFSVGLAAGLGFSSLSNPNAEGWEANAGLAMRILRWDSVVNINTGINYMYSFDVNFLSIPFVLNLNYTRKQNYSMYAGVGIEPSMMLAKYEGTMLSGFDLPLVANLLGYGARNSDIAFYMKYYLGSEMMTLGCRYTYYF